MNPSPCLSQIALLAPMRSELLPLIRLLRLQRAGACQVPLFRGAVGDTELTATLTGIGTQAAARTTEWILDAVAPDHLLVVGIAGGIGRSIRIGDLVVPASVIDLASGREYRPAPFAKIEARGILVTTDELLVDPARVAELERQGAIAVDMETAAIAAGCEKRACPWSAFRAISDRAADPAMDPAIFDLAGLDRSPNLAAVARFVLTRPQRLAQLMRLALDAQRAANTAAAAAARALAQA